jgi:glycosyltransferase involved in cell wall biosynthesis
MRILFCNYEYPPLGGGGGMVNAFLAQELAKRHQVTVLTSRARGFAGESVENGVKVVRVPVLFRTQQAVGNLPSMLAFVGMGIFEGRKLLQKDRYEVINTHFVLPSGPVGDALSHFGRIPNVLTVHGGDLYDPSKRMSPHRHSVLRMWARRLLRRADMVIGQSSNTLENLRRFYTPELEGVRVPLGIPKREFPVGSRTAYGFRDDEILLVTVGRLVPRKATFQLTRLIDSLRDRPVRLVIVGTGPQEHLLKEECRVRRVVDRVSFMGHVSEEDKYRILQVSDLYVSTSQHEGFGLVFLEAMASGLPVVCYDVGGQTDFLQDGETGFLVSLNDLDLFKRRCELLMRDPELRRIMGERNRRVVEDYFIEQCAQRYETAFTDVLNGSWQRRNM